MASLLEPCAEWDELEQEHRQWLVGFDRRYLRNWEKNRGGDYEAALCEAAARRLLQTHGVTVEPNEDLLGAAPTGSEQRPDYRCSTIHGEFFVEVTCITIATAIQETGLPHPFQLGCYFHGSLNNQIFEKCKKKTPQCSGMELPTLVAVGTFHHHASARCMTKLFANWLLTGEASVSYSIDTETGRAVSDAFQTTKLRSATFLTPRNNSILEARTSLSGILLCGFGCIPSPVLGVLHPYATHRFDPQLLPGIEFGRVEIDHATSHLCTYWPRGDE